MEQSPSWEANSFSASQEIPRILWNLEVHFRVHKSPPPVPLNTGNLLPNQLIYGVVCNCKLGNLCILELKSGADFHRQVYGYFET
jgi:hypothetical protein